MCMYVDKARNNFESTRAEVERLMKRIRSAEEDFKAPGCFTMEGYLYIQEKREAHKNHIFSVFFSHLCNHEKQNVCFFENVCHVLQAHWGVCGPDTTVLIKRAPRCSP